LYLYYLYVFQYSKFHFLPCQCLCPFPSHFHLCSMYCAKESAKSVSVHFTQSIRTVPYSDQRKMIDSNF
jgi:hypothetical protein